MEKIYLPSYFDEPNPTLFKLEKTTFEIGTVFEPGPGYGVVIIQGNKVVVAGENGRSITLDKKHTRVKKRLFKKEVEHIHVFAVLMVYKGSGYDGDYKGYSYFSYAKPKHKAVYLGINYAYNFTLNWLYAGDFVRKILTTCIPLEEMEKKGLGGAICLDKYIESMIEGYAAKYFDYHECKTFNDLLIKAGANTSGPEAAKYNQIMAAVEKSVWDELAFFNPVGKKPLTIYISGVSYK